MTLEDISRLWAKDQKLDRSALDVEAANIPTLHHTYWKLLAVVRKEHRDKHVLLQKLKHLKLEYFQGRLTTETRLSLGWPVQNLKILKPNLEAYIQNEPDVRTIQAEIDDLQDQLDFLTEIIKSINNRSFLLKTMMDFMRFSQGQ